jgi:glycine/D-amino acid oxidase-like deaminating enzyme
MANEAASFGRHHGLLEVLARAIIPPGERLSGGGSDTVKRLEHWFGGLPASHLTGYRALLDAMDWLSVPRTGHRLSRLGKEDAIRFVESVGRSPAATKRNLLRAVATPIKLAHFDDPTQFAAVGCPSFHSSERQLRVVEQPRWLLQVTSGEETAEDIALECEVVVVGTGAGGAACAHELASRGRAVLMLEEGPFVRREGFTGRAQEMVKKLYRDHGLTLAFGNAGIPVWAGRAVGGSTVVNSGTCYRAPDRVFQNWRDNFGLTEFSSEKLAPYYERVEHMLHVTQAKMPLTGGVGRVIARGAGKLGYHHEALQRNAPDCDGQGVCAFGCPTGAKRSTDVSYVPEALKRGAQLLTGARVDGIDVVAGRARGVSGKLASGASFRIKADAVVVAAGALMTPVLFKRAGLLKHSQWLGKNLSIHPATKVMALFDEPIDMGSAIPQGYAVDEFASEGIMFEGGSTPLEVTAASVPWTGRSFVKLLDQYRNLACFGFMVQDTSRGQVRAGRGYSPLITYHLNRTDTERIHRGICILTEIYLEAGARRVFPFLPGAEEIRSRRDLEHLMKKSIVPSDLDITAFHPLGTCRIGTDPEMSVLSPDHEAHGIESLYVTDGSAIPSSLGVNPQLTIMAMAHRAGEAIDARLS